MSSEATPTGSTVCNPPGPLCPAGVPSFVFQVVSCQAGT